MLKLYRKFNIASARNTKSGQTRLLSLYKFDDFKDHNLY